MTQIEIENLFKKIISDKGFSKTSGFDKHKTYNLRHRKVTFGLMLEVLFTVGVIGVEKKPYCLAKTLN